MDKVFASEVFEIENFKINKESEDEKYVEYKNTQKSSASYEQYQQLSDKEKSKLEIIYFFYVLLDLLYKIWYIIFILTRW